MRQVLFRDPRAEPAGLRLRPDAVLRPVRLDVPGRVAGPSRGARPEVQVDVLAIWSSSAACRRPGLLRHRILGRPPPSVLGDLRDLERGDRLLWQHHRRRRRASRSTGGSARSPSGRLDAIAPPWPSASPSAASAASSTAAATATSATSPGPCLPGGSPPWSHQVNLGLISPRPPCSLPVHPTQLYSALDGLVLFPLLWPISRSAGGRRGDGPADGHVSALPVPDRTAAGRRADGLRSDDLAGPERRRLRLGTPLLGVLRPRPRADMPTKWLAEDQ